MIRRRVTKIRADVLIMNISIIERFPVYNKVPQKIIYAFSNLIS